MTEKATYYSIFIVNTDTYAHNTSSFLLVGSSKEAKCHVQLRLQYAKSNTGMGTGRFYQFTTIDNSKSGFIK